MVPPTVTAWIKRLIFAAVLVCLGGTVAPKPADAQLYLNLPFVSLGVGYPYYGYPYYYGYPRYYYRAHYWGWRHRHWCYWHPHRCGWY